MSLLSSIFLLPLLAALLVRRGGFSDEGCHIEPSLLW